ncbi:50S ribosomal protein L19 [candidate division WOR-3 bacterium]|nr:50S ribosomal protein L19 [candidate division WOR-3 bacterium]
MDIYKIEESLVEKKEIPDFSSGDKVRVHTKFMEGKETRKQRFEGIVISQKGRGISKTFTVRKVTGGCGVERIFPLYSPTIEKIDILKQKKVRRAKLYYLRKKK